MKKIRNILMAAAAILSVAACSEQALDKVNEDVNHAKDANAKFTFADLCLSTAYTAVGGDFNTYLGVAVEHWSGVHNQLYKAEKRDGEWISSSCFNNAWSGVYYTLGNCRVVIAKTEKDSGASAEDEGNTALNAAAKVLYAYNSAILTDLFGDVPYSQACNYNEYKTPALDKQEDIYKDIYKNLDEAIAQLDGQAKLGIGAYDFIYNDDATKWLKFAYGLRARLTMRTILRASDKTAAYNQIIADADKSFTSAADQAQFAKYDGDNQLNPLFMYWYSREGIAASQSLADKLADRNDPRQDMIFSTPYDCEYVAPGDAECVPNGEGEEIQEAYTDYCFFLALNAPTYLLSYAEVQFLKAEALARKGDDAGAKAAAKAGIEAAFDIHNQNVVSAINTWGYTYEGDLLDAAAADAYYTAVVDTKTGDALLGEIMVQKYLSFLGANGGSVEAYNDVRRLKAEGKNYITLANPKNTDSFPLRCGYGSSDTTTNPNVQQAFGDGSYVYKEPVWWANGTR